MRVSSQPAVRRFCYFSRIRGFFPRSRFGPRAFGPFSLYWGTSSSSALLQDAAAVPVVRGSDRFRNRGGVERAAAGRIISLKSVAGNKELEAYRDQHGERG